MWVLGTYSKWGFTIQCNFILKWCMYVSLSSRLWQILCMELVPELCPLLIEDVTHYEETVRAAGAEALSIAVSQYQDQSPAVLSRLTELYQQKLYVSLSCSRTVFLILTVSFLRCRSAKGSIVMNICLSLSLSPPFFHAFTFSLSLSFSRFHSFCLLLSVSLSQSLSACRVI